MKGLNKLACHSFMDVGRGLKTSGSEPEPCEGSVSQATLSSTPRCVMLLQRSPAHTETGPFITDNKHTCHLLWRETLFLSRQYTKILEMIIWNNSKLHFLLFVMTGNCIGLIFRLLTHESWKNMKCIIIRHSQK